MTFAPFASTFPATQPRHAAVVGLEHENRRVRGRFGLAEEGHDLGWLRERELRYRGVVRPRVHPDQRQHEGNGEQTSGRRGQPAGK